MSNVNYDAFISYSHNERDTYIAKKLHFTLEHYQIPRKYVLFLERHILPEFSGIRKN